MNEVIVEGHVDICTRCGSDREVHVYCESDMCANFCADCANELKLWSSQKL